MRKKKKKKNFIFVRSEICFTLGIDYNGLNTERTFKNVIFRRRTPLAGFLSAKYFNSENAFESAVEKPNENKLRLFCTVFRPLYYLYFFASLIVIEKKKVFFIDSFSNNISIFPCGKILREFGKFAVCFRVRVCVFQNEQSAQNNSNSFA